MSMSGIQNKKGLLTQLFSLILAAISITGCATSYQSQSFTGGFTESQLDKNVFRVNFRGNGFTKEEQVADMALLRSAEIALDHNFKYFIVVDEKADVTQLIMQTPASSTTTAQVTAIGNTAYGTARTTTSPGLPLLIRKPRASNIIVCFLERPEIPGVGLVYDAKFLVGSLGAKYKH